MRRWWILPGMVGVFAAVLAYFLRDLIHEKIVVPLAYLWWRLGIYYQSIEEKTWLMLAVVVIALLAYASLISEHQFSKDKTSKDTDPVQGPVEGLALALKKSPRRTYYRWLVANQLARLARSFLMQIEGRSVQRWDGSLEGADWDPPEPVKGYLRYGLRHPFADAPSKSQSPLPAIEYLESKIGDHDDAD